MSKVVWVPLGFCKFCFLSKKMTSSKHAGMYLIKTHIYIFSIKFLYKVKCMHTTNVTGLNQKQKRSVQSWEPVVT